MKRAAMPALEEDAAAGADEAVAGERLHPAASLASLQLTRRRGTAAPARRKAGDLSSAPANADSDDAATAPAPAAPPAAAANDGAAAPDPAPHAAPRPPATADQAGLASRAVPEPGAEPGAQIPPPPPSPLSSDQDPRGNGTSAAAAADTPPAAQAVPSPPAPAPAPAPAAVQSRQPSRLPPDIYGYWAKLRQGRRFPSWRDVDSEEISRRWPNSFLLACDATDGRTARIGRAERLGGTGDGARRQPLVLTEPVIEWILATGRDVAHYGEPIRDEEVFDSPRGRAGYRIVAVPLSDDQRRIDHILCHVSRAANA